MNRIFISLIFCTFGFSDPPYWGTIFIDSDIITNSDNTTFQNIEYSGQGWRTMYDRRVNGWINVYAYLFNTYYSDNLYCEIQVNPEFISTDNALEEALFYAIEIGRLPTCLREDVETVWIHMGTEPFGGGNNNILIHTGQGIEYINDGILEETLVHEASHTSLDYYHASSDGWINAQNLDDEFISVYAQDNPTTEDIAESFLTWLAIRYRSDRISNEMELTILQTIPNRINYFDSQLFDMYPIYIEHVGDINYDDVINILDIVLMINMILDSEYSVIADINSDDTVDILDIISLVNLIMNGVPSICDGLTEVELWGECYNIESTIEIDFSGNSSNGWEGGLTGEIPAQIGNLINLNYLNLGHNDLIGSIPADMGNLTNLIYLVIHFNQLTGEVPEEVCDLVESNNLDMSWILNGNNLIYTCE